jgi:hypothetical protein
MMSRRMFDYSKTGVHFLVGGVKALDDWQSFPVLGSAAELKAEEPDWWILPDNRLAAVFREGKKFGLAYVDHTTGEFEVAEFKDTTELADELERIQASELLFSDTQREVIDALGNRGSAQPIESYLFLLDQAQQRLPHRHGRGQEQRLDQGLPQTRSGDRSPQAEQARKGTDGQPAVTPVFAPVQRVLVERLHRGDLGPGGAHAALSWAWAWRDSPRSSSMI